MDASKTLMMAMPVIQGAQHKNHETDTCRWNAAISDVISRTESDPQTDLPEVDLTTRF